MQNIYNKALIIGCSALLIAPCFLSGATTAPTSAQIAEATQVLEPIYKVVATDLYKKQFEPVMNDSRALARIAATLDSQLRPQEAALNTQAKLLMQVYKFNQSATARGVPKASYNRMLEEVNHAKKTIRERIAPYLTLAAGAGAGSMRMPSGAGAGPGGAAAAAGPVSRVPRDVPIMINAARDLLASFQRMIREINPGNAAMVAEDISNKLEHFKTGYSATKAATTGDQADQIATLYRDLEAESAKAFTFATASPGETKRLTEAAALPAAGAAGRATVAAAAAGPGRASLAAGAAGLAGTGLRPVTQSIKDDLIRVAKTGTNAQMISTFDAANSFLPAGTRIYEKGKGYLTELDENGNTVWHLAAEAGNLSAIQALMQLDPANKAVTNKKGETALTIAEGKLKEKADLRTNYTEIVRLLTAAAAGGAGGAESKALGAAAAAATPPTGSMRAGGIAGAGPAVAAATPTAALPAASLSSSPAAASPSASATPAAASVSIPAGASASAAGAGAGAVAGAPIAGPTLSISPSERAKAKIDKESMISDDIKNALDLFQTNQLLDYINQQRKINSHPEAWNVGNVEKLERHRKALIPATPASRPTAAAAAGAPASTTLPAASLSSSPAAASPSASVTPVAASISIPAGTRSTEPKASSAEAAAAAGAPASATLPAASLSSSSAAASPSASVPPVAASISIPAGTSASAAGAGAGASVAAESELDKQKGKLRNLISQYSSLKTPLASGMFGGAENELNQKIKNFFDTTLNRAFTISSITAFKKAVEYALEISQYTTNAKWGSAGSNEAKKADWLAFIKDLRAFSSRIPAEQ